MLTFSFSMAVFARIAFAIITRDMEVAQKRREALKEWNALLDGINKITDSMKKNRP